MILKKDMLTKPLKKGRLEAVALLNDLARIGGVPQPHYRYEPGGSVKKPVHYYKVQFRIPTFLFQQQQEQNENDVAMISGAGKCRSKAFAKSLAALEAVHRLEQCFGVDRGKLKHQLEDFQAAAQAQQDARNATPITEQLEGVSWNNIPVDPSFPQTLPATRQGRISFYRELFPQQRQQHDGDDSLVYEERFQKALVGAKAMTLTSQEGLPEVAIHANQTDIGVLQRWTNIQAAAGKIKGFHGPMGESSMGIEDKMAEILALEQIGHAVIHGKPAYQPPTKPGKKKKKKNKSKKQQRHNLSPNYHPIIEMLRDQYESYQQDETHQEEEAKNQLAISSFGLAKLFVRFPNKQHLTQIQELVKQIIDLRKESNSSINDNNNNNNSSPLLEMDSTSRASAQNKATPQRLQQQKLQQFIQARIHSFRQHQQKIPLPADALEAVIPRTFYNPVTIVRGGTGSGKTTRYPAMLSLFGNNDDKNNNYSSGAGEDDDDPTRLDCANHHHQQQHQRTNILVVQPRRLACQTAAQRVAYEQGYQIGQKGSPVGYSIRFESFPADRRTQDCTIDFQTPGVVLRQATRDPLLSNITHLCIDEVHERNADIDLLLALAKQAQQQRRRQQEHRDSLPQLRIVLMSATLDSDQWEAYFTADDIDDNQKGVETIDVPNVQRFPIQEIHLGDDDMFPSRIKSMKELARKLKRPDEDLDETICNATADLAISAFQNNLDDDEGSVLCFLPGIDEIRMVERLIHQGWKSSNKKQQRNKPIVRYLHSSISSKEQAKVFLPGSKIILATNIAETSVTIPDVKVVIDSGRERQFSMLDSSGASEGTTVVGSQLVTVNISQASAKQRAGRAGRVSAGTCYRLFSREGLTSKFREYTIPEMQRMELSQLILHSISLYHPSSGHPLSLLLGAPDPPEKMKIQQTLNAMKQQGLIKCSSNNAAGLMDIDLTPLGQAVSEIPASPRIARMLFLGLGLRAITPALDIASLMSVPKVFSQRGRDEKFSKFSEYCSDIIVQLSIYHQFLELDKEQQRNHPRRSVFDQVSRVRRQLEHSIRSHVNRNNDNQSHLGGDNSRDDAWDMQWNSNSHRVAAQASLVCCATPHIAHLVNWKSDFATRDVAGQARIHPSSINYDHGKRSHWYLYHELRTTKEPYLHITSAASPLELALFSDSTFDQGEEDDDDDQSTEAGVDTVDLKDWSEEQSYLSFLEKLNEDATKDEWSFIVDQWVPVHVFGEKQRETFLQLKHLLMYEMLQRVADNPKNFLDNEMYEQLVLHVLAAIEHHRIKK